MILVFNIFGLKNLQTGEQLKLDFEWLKKKALVFKQKLDSLVIVRQ